MADTNKITYVSLEKLGYYDQKLKAWVTSADEAAKTELKGLVTAEETRAKGVEATLAGDIETAQGAAEGAMAHSEALAAKVGTVPEGSTVMGIITNIQENAYDDTEIRGLISGLDTNKADKTQVATDIAAAVKVEEDARKEAVQGVQNAVDTLSGTHATDKKALEDAIALKADQTALDAVSAVANAAVKQADYDVKVKALEDEDARIAGLVAAEAERAAGVEADHEERLVEVETFFKTAENETLDEALDTLVELQKYLGTEGAVADQMLLDIAANKKAIEDHVATDHDFAAADAALKEILDAADGAQVERIEALEAKFTGEDSVEDQIADAIADANAYTDEKVGALAETVGENTEAIGVLNGTGEGSVAKAVSDAVTTAQGTLQGNIDAVDDKADANAEAIAAINNETTGILAQAKKYADDEDAKIEERVGVLEAASATHALQSDLNALTGRVATAEGEIDTLQTEMDAVEALAAANESAIKALQSAVALKADASALTAVSDRVTTLETWHNNFVEATTGDIDGLFA